MSSTGYSAPDEDLKNSQLVRAPSREEEKAFYTDPFREFEITGSATRYNGTLYCWGTLSKADRIAFLKNPESGLQALVFPPKPSEDEKGAAVQRRWRTLNFIIQEESRLQHEGWQEVAIIAFNYLVPRPSTK